MTPRWSEAGHADSGLSASIADNQNGAILLAQTCDSLIVVISPVDQLLKVFRLIRAKLSVKIFEKQRIEQARHTGRGGNGFTEANSGSTRLPSASGLR